MANMTESLVEDVLDGITGVSTLFSSTMALGLFTADPTETGSVTNELSGNGYARKSLSGLFSAAVGSNGEVDNSSVINFSAATADWTTVTHVGFMKSATAGTDDMIVHVALENPVTLLNTQQFSFAIGDLVIEAL